MDIAIPGYLHDFCTHLYQLQQANSYCDVSIATRENHYVPAHSVVLLGSQSPMLHQMVRSRSECCPLVVEDFIHESTAVVQSFVKSLYTGRVEVTSDNVESLKSLYLSAKLDKFVDAIDNFMIYNNITKCIPAFETGKNFVEVQENHAAHFRDGRDGTISLNSFNALHSVHSTMGLVEREFQLNQAINSAVDMVSFNSEMDRGNSEKSYKCDSLASVSSNVDDNTQDQDTESSSHQLLKPTQCFKILRSSNVSSLSDDEDGRQQGNFKMHAGMTFFDLNLEGSPNCKCEQQGYDIHPDQGNCKIVENQSQIPEIKHITSALTAVKKEDSDHNSVFHDKNALLFEAKSLKEAKQAVGKTGSTRKRKRNDEYQEKLKIPCKTGSATKPRRKQADLNRPRKVRKTSNMPDQEAFGTGSSGGPCLEKFGEKNMPSEIPRNVESFDMNRQVKVEVMRPAPDDHVGKMDDTLHVSREEISAETCDTSLKDGSIAETKMCELMDKSVPETETCKSKNKSVPETCETSLHDRSIAETETCEVKNKAVAETFRTISKDKSSAAKTVRKKTQNSTKRARKEKCGDSKSSGKDKFTSVNKRGKKLTVTDTLGNGMISEDNKTLAEDNTYSDNPLLHEIYLRSNRLSPVWLKHKHYTRICGYCDKQEADCQCTPAVGGQKHKCLFCPRLYRDRPTAYAHMKSVHALICTHCEYRHHNIEILARHLYAKHGLVLDKERFPVLTCDNEGCNFTSMSKTELRRHVEAKHSEAQYHCELCGKSFRYKHPFKLHLASHDPANLIHKCEECGKQFTAKGLLNVHVKMCHKGMRRQDVCHHCSWRGESRNLKIHLFKCHGEPLPDNITQYKCDVCDYFSFYPGALAEHKAIHTGERSLQCQECGKMFNRVTCLRNHEIIHKAKNVHCEYEGCSYRCHTVANMKKHVTSRHMMTRPFACHLCSYSCKLTGNLDKHLRGVHKLQLNTIENLRQKMLEGGSGYDKIIQRHRSIRNGENVSKFDSPSTTASEASL